MQMGLISTLITICPFRKEKPKFQRKIIQQPSAVFRWENWWSVWHRRTGFEVGLSNVDPVRETINLASPATVLKANSSLLSPKYNTIHNRLFPLQPHVTWFCASSIFYYSELKEAAGTRLHVAKLRIDPIRRGSGNHKDILWKVTNPRWTLEVLIQCQKNIRGRPVS